MNVKTFEAQYELIEFNHYIGYDEEKGKTVGVVDIVVKCDNVDFIKKEFDSTFIVESEGLSYVFSDYSLSEYYELGGGLIQVICIK